MRLSKCNFTSSPQHKTYRCPPCHRGFGGFANQLSSRGVTLLRQPEQRIISGFHYSFSSYDVRGHGKPNITTYARAVAGCSVRMLVRPSVSGSSDAREAACGHSPPPNEKEVDQAKAILSAFQFVGLTDEWDLTVCLWHARFGPTSCHISEFLNTRPHDGNVTSAPSYDVSILNGFIDRYDTSLYEPTRRNSFGTLSIRTISPAHDVPHGKRHASLRMRAEMLPPAGTRLSNGVVCGATHGAKRPTCSLKSKVCARVCSQVTCCMPR